MIHEPPASDTVETLDERMQNITLAERVRQALLPYGMADLRPRTIRDVIALVVRPAIETPHLQRIDQLTNHLTQERQWRSSDNASLTKEIADRVEEIERLEEQSRQQQAMLDRARVWLLKHAHHASSCPDRMNNDRWQPCNCGLAELIDTLTQAESQPVVAEKE